MVFKIADLLKRSECSSTISTTNMNTIILYSKFIYARSCLLTLVKELLKPSGVDCLLVVIAGSEERGKERFRRLSDLDSPARSLLHPVNPNQNYD